VDGGAAMLALYVEVLNQGKIQQQQQQQQGDSS
jgi:hypothetical protein